MRLSCPRTHRLLFWVLLVPTLVLTFGGLYLEQQALYAVVVGSDVGMRCHTAPRIERSPDAHSYFVLVTSFCPLDAPVYHGTALFAITTNASAAQEVANAVPGVLYKPMPPHALLQYYLVLGLLTLGAVMLMVMAVDGATATCAEQWDKEPEPTGDAYVVLPEGEYTDAVDRMEAINATLMEANAEMREALAGRDPSVLAVPEKVWLRGEAPAGTLYVAIPVEEYSWTPGQ